LKKKKKKRKMNDKMSSRAEKNFKQKKKSSSMSSLPITYWTIVKQDPAFNEVSAIVHWRDPVKSGLIFGIISLAYFLLTSGEYTLISLIAYLLLSLLSVSFAYVKFVQFRDGSAPNPLQAVFTDPKFRITKESASKHVDTFLAIYNHTLDGAKEVFLSANVGLTLRFLFFFYLVARIGDWFSGLTAVYLVVLGFFIWPRLYEEKHTEIDQYVALARSEVTKYINLGLDTLEKKLPPNFAPYVNNLKQKVKVQ